MSSKGRSSVYVGVYMRQSKYKWVSKCIQLYKHNKFWFCRIIHSTLCGLRSAIFAHTRSMRVEPQMIMGNFDTSTNKVSYCGTIERILKVNFISFHTYLFKCHWFTSVVKWHENGLYMVDCTQFHKGRIYNFIHPTSCEQVSTKQGLWLIVRVVSNNSLT